METCLCRDMTKAFDDDNDVEKIAFSHRFTNKCFPLRRMAVVGDAISYACLTILIS